MLRRGSATRPPIVVALAMLAVTLLAAGSGCAAPRRVDAASSGDVEPVGVDLGGRGPYPVGMVDLQLGDRNLVVLYPTSEEGAAAVERRTSHSTLDGMPADARAFVPEPLRITLGGDVHLGAAVNDEGPFPVVLFSHATGRGNRSAIQQLEHLASWGFVAAAPQHRERDLLAVLSGQATATAEPDVRDLRNTLDLLRRENTRTDSVLLGNLDLDRVGVIGHGEGARAAAILAIESDEVDTWIGVAPLPPVDPALLGDAGAIGAVLEATPPPAQPALLVSAGEPAGFAQLERAWLPDVRLVVAPGLQHVAVDECRVIAERGGLVPIAPLLPVPLEVLAALEAGCAAGEVADPALTDLLRHLEVAQLRWALGFDESPVSLSAEFLRTLYPFPPDWLTST